MSDSKYMSGEEMVDSGYLLEVNRRFFHPLGLALAAQLDEEGNYLGTFQVLDSRDDPEGVYFDFCAEDDEYREKYQKMAKEWEKRTKDRQEKLGYDIEPTPSEWNNQEVDMVGIFSQPIKNLVEVFKILEAEVKRVEE